MKLLEWRLANGLSMKQCADGVGYWWSTWRRWELGYRIPDPEPMRRIYEFTKGAVTPNDFYPFMEAANAPAKQ